MKKIPNRRLKIFDLVILFLTVCLVIFLISTFTKRAPIKMQPEYKQPVNITITSPISPSPSLSYQAAIFIPTNTPVPTYISQTEVHLSPWGSKVGSNANGDVTVIFKNRDEHYSKNPAYKILSFIVNGSIRNLSGEKEYMIWLCKRHGTDCGSAIRVKTDQNGYGDFRLPDVTNPFGSIGITTDKDNPIDRIIVTSKEDSCSTIQSPCLQGTYHASVE